MKILYDNYLDDATITTDSEESLYPVSNVTHRFLEKVYKPATRSATVTIDLGSYKTVSCIAIGYTSVINIDTDTTVLSQSATDIVQLDQSATDIYRLRIDEGIDYELRNASGTALQSGSLEIENDTNMTYITPTSCRYIVLTITSLTDVYIGGIGAGDPLEYEYTDADPSLSTTARGTTSRTTGGQVLGRNYKPLREWSVSVTEMSNDKRKETEDMVYHSGVVGTVYADLYNYAHDVEPPMYGIITSYGSFGRSTYTRDYSMSFTIEEAR